MLRPTLAAIAAMLVVLGSAAAQTLPGAPHQIQLSCALDPGASSCSVALPTQKAGTAFLVQTESVYRTQTTGTMQVYVDPRIAGSYTAFALPLVNPSGTFYPGATQSATVFIEGQGGVVNVYRSDTSGTDYAYISLSGYIVTLPAS